MSAPSPHELSDRTTLDYLKLARDGLVQYLDRHSSDLNAAEINRLQTLQTKLKHNQIEIAVFGLVSRGKTAVINALLGKKVGATGAVHGITQAPMAVEFMEDASASEQVDRPEAPDRSKKVQLQLIDTPGLDEVDGEAKGELALAIARQADLILFVIAGDMTRLEQEMLAELRNFCKPMLLVFNKADLYPECDRVAIHAALQNEQLQRLISPDEIILTAAEPLPTRVRLEYVGGQGGQNTTEIWEPHQPQVQALKQKILDLLNLEGKALLAINALRSLAEVQDEFTDAQLHSLPRLRTFAALVFGLEAIALGIAPSFWLDAAISVTINLLIALVWTQKLPLSNPQLWLGAILLNAPLTAACGLEAQLAQIGWVGVTIPFMLKQLQLSLHRHSGWGKGGARTLMQQILQQVPANSILKRLPLPLRSTVNT